jgi:hypothetical protein
MPFRSRGFGASSVASFASLAGSGAAPTTSGVGNARAKEVDSLTELATWFVVSEAVQGEALVFGRKMWQSCHSGADLPELVWWHRTPPPLLPFFLQCARHTPTSWPSFPVLSCRLWLKSKPDTFWVFMCSAQHLHPGWTSERFAKGGDDQSTHSRRCRAVHRSVRPPLPMPCSCARAWV